MAVVWGVEKAGRLLSEKTTKAFIEERRTLITSDSHLLNEPWQEEWPIEDLECLNKCPVCEGQERSLLYNDLVDNIFFCAPGKWTMFQCQYCSCAYLDPRPNAQSIYRAYQTYYTHGSGSKDLETTADKNETQGSYKRQLIAALGNGYRNRRFGASELPSFSIGYYLAPIFSKHKKRMDILYRHLPKCDAGGTMLDIGCGDGSFLTVAKSAGWKAIGIDTDENAVAVAKEKGFEVYQGDIDFFGSQSNLFDAITLSHVIEHVHDPIQLLKSSLRLLKPGGQIHIETPNLESSGHMYFGRHWRGLEPARHLVLFDPQSLKKMLIDAGFSSIQIKAPSSGLPFIFKSSYKMSVGEDPRDQSMPLPKTVKELICEHEKVQRKHIGKSEFVFMIGKKDK